MTSPLLPHKLPGEEKRLEREEERRTNLVHDEIEGEEFNEVVAIVLERSTIEGVKERVTSTIGHATRPSISGLENTN